MVAGFLQMISMPSLSRLLRRRIAMEYFLGFEECLQYILLRALMRIMLRFHFCRQVKLYLLDFCRHAYGFDLRVIQPLMVFDCDVG